MDKKSDTSQSFKCDFLVKNLARPLWEVDGIEFSVADGSGKRVLRRFIDSNDFAPAIETVPTRIVPPRAKILVFNPFYSFRPNMNLHTLTYRFDKSIPQESPKAHKIVRVKPQVHKSKTVLSLPVKGRFIDQDEHDFYTHQRRLNTEYVAAKDARIVRNFMRYSPDINPGNDHFDIFRNTSTMNED